MAPNFPKKTTLFQQFDKAEDFAKLNAQFDEILRWIQNYVAPEGSASSAVDHALLSHLAYAASGHTGFQPAGSYLTAETDPVFSAWLIATPPLYSYDETDPIFTAWDKSTGISITESQISDLQGYLTAETDPIVGAITGIVKADGAGNISAASPGTDYAAALGLDENYVTDAQLVVIGNTSNTNTGDQTLYATFGIDIDGAGSVPATGSKGFITLPFNCTIQNWYLACDASGDAVIDLKVSGTSIVGGGGNKPTLTGAQSGNAAVSGWTDDTMAAGVIVEFNLDSIATITHANLVLKVVKT